MSLMLKVCSFFSPLLVCVFVCLFLCSGRSEFLCMLENDGLDVEPTAMQPNQRWTMVEEDDLEEEDEDEVLAAV